MRSHAENSSGSRSQRCGGAAPAAPCVAAFWGVTRQMVFERSSATINAPRGSTATPTGRPRSLRRLSPPEAGNEVNRRTCRAAVAERHEAHPITNRHTAVPAAMLPDKHGIMNRAMREIGPISDAAPEFPLPATASATSRGPAREDVGQCRFDSVRAQQRVPVDGPDRRRDCGLLPRQVRRGARPRAWRAPGQGVSDRAHRPHQRADDLRHTQGGDGARGVASLRLKQVTRSLRSDVTVVH